MFVCPIGAAQPFRSLAVTCICACSFGIQGEKRALSFASSICTGRESSCPAKTRGKLPGSVRGSIVANIRRKTSSNPRERSLVRCGGLSKLCSELVNWQSVHHRGRNRREVHESWVRVPQLQGYGGGNDDGSCSRGRLLEAKPMGRFVDLHVAAGSVSTLFWAFAKPEVWYSCCSNECMRLAIKTCKLVQAYLVFYE